MLQEHDFINFVAFWDTLRYLVMVHVVCGEGHCNKADNNAISLPFLGFGMQLELKIRKMHALFFAKKYGWRIYTSRKKLPFIYHRQTI